DSPAALMSSAVGAASSGAGACAHASAAIPRITVVLIVHSRRLMPTPVTPLETIFVDIGRLQRFIDPRENNPARQPTQRPFQTPDDTRVCSPPALWARPRTLSMQHRLVCS